MHFSMKSTCGFPLFFHILLVPKVLGHMQMSSPYPLRSPLNSNNAGDIVDYNYRAPLSPDGSNYPCKGYLGDVPGISSVEKYIAGNKYQMTIEGEASHGGGSCQLSLSYDNGASFQVIHSMIGGCPLSSSYDFTIPVSAPAKEKAIFAWTWFNRIGNREMYMNCAVVDIVASENSLQSSSGTINGPEIFKANIFGDTCISPEGHDVVFPNAGDSVIYGGEYTGIRPASTVVDGCPASNVNGGVDIEVPENTLPVEVPNPTPTPIPVPTVSIAFPSSGQVLVETQAPTPLAPAPPAPATETASASTTISAISTVTQSIGYHPSTFTTIVAESATSVAPKPTASAPVSVPIIPAETQPEVPSSPCNPGALVCVTTTTLALCLQSGELEFLGPVASGTICKDGEVIKESTAGYCAEEEEGDIKCGEDGTSWCFCDAHTWVFMGNVPPGTTCKDGKIEVS